MKKSLQDLRMSGKRKKQQKRLKKRKLLLEGRRLGGFEG